MPLRWSSTSRRTRAHRADRSAASPPDARASPSTAKSWCAQRAHGTDSQQSLRGLLAGAGAEIDVRPQLEIYTDDVRCSHGATAGKLDDNMLFYLLSRGLDRETAQRLLKWAFLEDVVAKHRSAASCAGRSSRAWPGSCRKRRPRRSCCNGCRTSP